MPDVVTFYPTNGLLIPPGEVTEAPAPCGILPRPSGDGVVVVEAATKNPAERPPNSPIVVSVPLGLPLAPPATATP